MAVRHGWGMAHRARSLVYQPLDADEVAEALSDADARGLSVTARGAGQSYGDAALNQGGALVEVGGIRRILRFDTNAGVLHAKAGTTVADVWRHTLPAGWWPSVVPGGMEATLGGCVAMDVYGKNHVRAGAFGQHVEAVTLVDGRGTVQRLSRSADSGRRDWEVTLDDVIGAQGLTGTVVDVTIRLRRVHSGFLEVEASATRSLAETFDALDRGAREADHAVAWLDCTTRRTGRGLVRHGRELPPDHSATGTGLDPESQYLPALVGGMLPAPHAWRALRLLANRPGIQALNAARYLFAAARGARRYLQGHAAFHFSLDSIPDWKRAYGADGLVQHQMFVPGDRAREAFGDALSQQRKLGVPSYLAVMARHLPEGGASTHALDGYSLAMDFPVSRGEAYGRLMRLLRSLERILEDHGGRVYAAKDAVGMGRLPERRDPLFSSNLVRRWERGLR